MNIRVDNVVLRKTLNKFDGDHAVVMVPKTKFTYVELVEDNKLLLKSMVDGGVFKGTILKKAKTYLMDRATTLKSTVKNPLEFYQQILTLTQEKEFYLEMKIGHKWYPMVVGVEKFRTMMGDIVVAIRLSAKIGSLWWNKRFQFGDWDFLDAADKSVPQKINDLLLAKGLRVASKEAIEHTTNLTKKVMKLNSNPGKEYTYHGFALSHHDYWGWDSFNLGSKDSTSNVIVEPTLENGNHDDYFEEDTVWSLPFIRVFSLEHKSYMFVDVENLQPRVYDTKSVQSIVLPDDIMKAIGSIFNTNKEDVFGDLFQGRHGGIVVLANGPPGVGKTLTAEVFAEHQERPLYCMEMSEIGTNLAKVEQSLRAIFARAKKWNAVLLFDEADIFLSERVSSDLERSAIVGIFLRLLDYYEGTFFLTTNRGEAIDPAFKSRVTLYINYPHLSVETRQTIWQSMFKAAGIETVPNDHWMEVYAIPLNGRQIRNQVRLLKLMFPKEPIEWNNVKQSLQFSAYEVDKKA